LSAEYRIKLSIKQVENGQFCATSPELPGLVAQGRTVTETMEIAHDVAKKILESYLEHDDPLPMTLRKFKHKMEVEVTVGI
jgi:predicted RNase H-like HicB family nuclease